MMNEASLIPKKGLMEVLTQEMRLRNYSLKTIKAYKSCIRSLAQYFDPKHTRELTNEEIHAFLVHQVEIKKLSAGTISQMLNAFRFLYVELYKRPFILKDLKRPRKERKLPVVLSEEEVRIIFNAIGNLKHRTMLMLVYSTGIRVGELVHLKPEDIDSERKMIHIRGGKGKKDRYTILADVVLTGLREYWKAYKPKTWLFEGLIKGKPYSPRSAQQVFEQAKEKAGIRKQVSIHSLRHLTREIAIIGGMNKRLPLCVHSLIGYIKNYYNGYIADLHGRIQLCNEGKIESTKNRVPLELIY